jgi:hypothetical protein
MTNLQKTDWNVPMTARLKKTLLSSVVAVSFSMSMQTAFATNNNEDVYVSEAAWSQTEQSGTVQSNAWQLEDVSLIAEAKAQMRISLPIADTSNPFADYSMTKTRVMSPELSAKYPQMQSYEIRHGEDIGYLVLTGNTIRGAYQIEGKWHDVLSTPESSTDGVNDAAKSEMTVSIVPSFDNQVEAKQALQQIESLHQELLSPEFLKKALAKNGLAEENLSNTEQLLNDTGEVLTSYRLAVSASGEYTTRLGGTVEDALAGIVTLFTRVNQILEKDLAITFELVGNTDSLIYLNAATDPFSNDNASADLDANQEVTDNTIGSANYDIGHLVNTNGGGLAGLGSICINSFKAQGYTGSPNPIGERFIVDLLIHEVGHQLGGEHSFNATESSCGGGNRSSSGRSAVEFGSGTTIMSYAGLCNSQDLRNFSSPHFHAFSVSQMRQTIERNNCGTDTAQNNTPPLIALDGTNYTIPANTPFLLDATIMDAEQSALENIWEQVNPGGFSGGTASIQEASEDNGDNPLFRSFELEPLTYRYFPRFPSILSGNLIPGEVYPDTNRQLTMRLVSRDQEGGVASEDVTIDVVKTSDSFAITSQLQDSTWSSGSTQTITWNTGDSELAPINCANVELLVDTNNDTLFEYIVASEIPNTGSAQIVVPSLSLDNARLMLKCADNIFFSVSEGSVTFSSDALIAPVIVGQAASIEIEEEAGFIIPLTSLVVNDADSDFPNGFTLSVFEGDNYTVSGNVITPAQDFNGMITVPVQVNDGSQDSNIFNLDAIVTPLNDQPVVIDQLDVNIIEDQSITLRISDLVVTDVDNNQADLFLIVGDGSDYTFEGNTITPTPEFNGNLAVNVSVGDGIDTSSPYSLIVTVASVNDAPVAQNDEVVLTQNDGPTEISVLNNDTDADAPEGDVIQVVAVDYAGQGTVSFTANSVTYQPATGFTGTESVTYTIADTAGLEASATITLLVNAPVELGPPPVEDDSSGGGGGGSLPLSLIAMMSLIAFIRRSRGVK